MNDLIQRSASHDPAPMLGTGPPGPWASMLNHKLLALGLFASIITLAVLVILFYPREYHSTAKLLLKIGRENVTLDPTATTTGETQSVQRTRESEVITALEMMASREILHGVVEELTPGVIISGALPGKGSSKSSNPLGSLVGSLKKTVQSIDPIDDQERAIIGLESNLRISAPSEAGVVTVDYRTDTPELAQAVVALWVELFQQHYITSTRTRGAFEFFIEQDKVINQELDAVRTELMEAKNQYGLVTIEGQQKLLEQQIQTVMLEKLTAESQLAEIQSRRDALEKLAGQVEETTITHNVSGLPNESRDMMRSRLYELEVEEKRLSAKLMPNHPHLKEVRAQLENAAKVVEEQDQQREEVTTGLNPTRQVLDERLALERAEELAVTTKATALDKQADRLRQNLESVNQQERTVVDLERRLELLEERYRIHSHRLEEARLDRELEEQRVSSVNVVQNATLEYRPVSPRKKLCAAFGLVAALAAAFGAPMWIESGKSNRMARLRLAELTGSDPHSLTTDTKSHGADSSKTVGTR